jgi:hypothetical protein
MRTNTISIHEISLYTGNHEICVKGRMQKDQLSYDTSLFINSTQLNMVLSQLQKINTDMDISSAFKTQTDDEGNLFMWLNTGGLQNNSIEWERFSPNKKQLLIRA